MAKTINQLTSTKVQKLTKPGMHPDGAGLYLQVTSEGAKSWILRYSLRSNAREMGLGSLRKVSLADARAKAAECHKLLDDHVDPIEHRARARAAAALTNTKTITFKEAADAYVTAHRPGWKNIKHATQWRQTLTDHAEPVLGKLLVSDITTEIVQKVLDPIWTTKTETATRVRGRIESVLDWTKVKGYRTGENPARWRGNLDHLLPKPSKVRPVEHHPALPYDELPEFIAKLRQQEGVSARALEFTILTAARTGEVIKANPSEVNRQKRLWVVPAERMKLKREHSVLLSDQALQLLNGASEGFLFPNPLHPEKHLSNVAMDRVLERMGYGRGRATVHGFRSTFKDWTRDRTRFENYVSEAALAHASGDKVEAAYARSTVLDKRRQLMDAWAEFCTKPAAQSTSKVVKLRSAAE
jgi:integrase